jgi:hypothetical protein
MRTLTLMMLMLISAVTAAQTIENANIYPSNLEENMYFERFNQTTNTIEGLNFLVLSDGNNSQHATPPFEISLYLLPEGSTSKDDLIIVKKYEMRGIYHFGSHEFENVQIDLNETPGIQPGNYRFGIWVNSNESFTEETNDNATLFKKPIKVTKATRGTPSDRRDVNNNAKSDDDNDDDDWW